MFLKPWVVESILSFYEVYPLNACTYFGVDSGIEPINLSLFMDVMRAAAKNITQEKFVGETDDPIRRARTLIYEKINKCIYRIAIDSAGRFVYPDPHKSASSLLDSFLQFINIPMATLPHFKKGLLSHAFVEGKCNASSFFINSYVGMDVTVDASSILSHTMIEAPYVSIGRRCVINGLHIPYDKQIHPEEPLVIPDEIVFHQFQVNLAVAQLDNSSIEANVAFGLHDNIQQCVDNEKATFCNIPWQKYLKMMEIDDVDLWPAMEPVENRSLFTARLFPVLSKKCALQLIMWLMHPQHKDVNMEIKKKSRNMLETWRSSWRFSIAELMELISYTDTLKIRKACFAKVATKLMERQLANSSDTTLTGLYNAAAVEGFSQDLLVTIDKLASQCMDEVKLARLFANVATILGCLSGGKGGIRSGPAGNVEWRAAYNMLKNGDYERAVAAMKPLRNAWMGSPQLIIRAARHYEGAQQTLVAKACSTAMNYVFLRPGAPVVPIGRWILVETPCRIDLAGAWSDTPPICYEIGGVVLGAAISINGKMPIGAKCRKINQPIIKVGYLDENDKVVANWTFDSMELLTDFDSPFSQAALIKACLVTAGIIAPPNAKCYSSSEHMSGLVDQLMSTVGSPGLEIYSWSNLPQGSGLGTSSILAGALISALWSLRGLTFDASSTIHAVLHFEQLLTTGGGWQDQVHGLIGGIKLAHSSAGLPVNIRWHQLHLSNEVLSTINKRLLLIYSGQTRLAKNILQNVLRNWYSNDPTIISTERSLIQTANDAAERLEQRDFDGFASLVTRSHKLKKKMAPGSETNVYLILMEALKDVTSGYSMCGAGGGGFIYFILKNESMRESAIKIIETTQGLQGCVVYDAEISIEGATTKFMD